MQYAISKIQYTICDIKYCHNVICIKLCAMDNSNMLYSIDNVQYGICNLSISIVKYISLNVCYH